MSRTRSGKRAAPATAGRYEIVATGNESVRRFESAETNRLNSAHWIYAQDESVNAWIAAQLPTIRARAAYECRQNGTLLGMMATHADDIVGPDGPTLQVESDDQAYTRALEQTWSDWWAAPTPRPNVSGAAWLKLAVRSLWKNGEYLARMVTDPMAEGPVSMRIQPVHPRRLASPAQQAGNPNVFAGIEFDALTRPTRYWIADARIDGQNISATYDPWPADLVIHEFIIEEEDQARGIPWFNTGLQPSADLRDYDDQVQDAARQIADQCGILYTESLDVPPAQVASAIKVQRRTIKAAPPGWKPFVYPAAQPAVQYPDYRAERQRELGRPVGMPLMMIRLDCARYNYSSARLETQNYYRAVAGFQQWMSGSQRSTGTLNRLVDEVARESRFSVPALRRRPPRVRYQWTWPPRPHVDPSKESDAEKTALDTRTLTLTDALAARGRDLETQVAMLSRERDLLTQAGLPLPSWMREEPTPAAQPANAQPSKTPPTRADLDAIEDRITSLEAEPHG